jgi:VanZ family protein
LELYSLLLIATPFIMLRTYLQDAIGRLSASTFPLFGLRIPVVPTVAAGLLIGLAVLLRRRINRHVLLAGLLALAMMALGQSITDIYFGHKFFELQQNWHYIAYSIFAILAYRDMRPRGVPLARCLLVTFALAALCSTFDEGFQLFLNTRVFDMSDIGKDLWGVLIGMTVVLVGGSHREFGAGAWRRIRQRRMRDYLSHAPSTWVLLVVLAFIYLGCSSLLTEHQYCGAILLLTLGIFGAFFLFLHLSQGRWGGRLLLALAALGATGLGASILRYRNDGVVHDGYALAIYRGVPIPFFDLLIDPGGGFRLVDKKHYFKSRDQVYLKRRRPDILIIGTGYRGLGGLGFPHQRGSGFTYNPYTQRGTQVIILESREACALYNQLKRDGKNVLFVLHTTC